MRATCLFTACVLWGCHAPPTDPAPPAPPAAGLEPTAIAADDPRLRYTGWFDRRVPKAVRFAWPGSHVEAAFDGTSIRAQLTDTPVEDETRDTDWLQVVIDEQAPRAVALREGRHEYVLATGLAPGTHRVLLWKRTEAEVGTVTLHGFRLDPGAALAPLPAPPARRMVFVGDSITAGYGNEGSDGSCHWSAARENSYATYGAVAARELGAAYLAMAWSGKGVTRNYEPRDRPTMPELYARVIPTDDASPLLPDDVADVVVVNLGTNDFFQGVPDGRAFIAAYDALLGSLRRRYPDALLVLGLGPMLADDHPQPRARSLLRDWLTTARDRRRRAGDDAIEIIELWSDPADGVGCDFHPNLKTHARLGRELADLVRDRLDGW